MNSNDGDDDLEERKGNVWSLDEVRSSGADTIETSDTSDTANEKSAATASDTTEPTDTSGISDDESPSTTSDPENSEDTTDTSDTPETESEINDSVVEADGETVRQMTLDADTKGMIVRDLHNVNVYLYESVYQEMQVKYKELDTEYFATHGEDLSKNKDFFNAVFRAGLQSPQLKEELEID